MQRGRHLVLWDGECGMCRRFAESVQRQDAAGALELVPYQACPSPPMTPELAAACEKALYVLTTDGRTLRGVEALLLVYETLGWRGTWLGRIPPLSWFLAVVYAIVARNRRWSSKVLYTGDQGVDATCQADFPEPEKP